MKLSDARDAYYDASGKLSDISRQLAFAALAVVWIFKIDDGNKINLPSALEWAALLAILSLIFDFCQYALKASIWGFYHRFKEKQNLKLDSEFLAPAYFPKLILVPYFAKLVLLGFSYIALLTFLWSKI